MRCGFDCAVLLLLPSPRRCCCCCCCCCCHHRAAAAIHAAAPSASGCPVRLADMWVSFSRWATDFVVVGIPSRLSVAECARLLSALADQGVAVNHMVVNQIVDRCPSQRRKPAAEIRCRDPQRRPAAETRKLAACSVHSESYWRSLLSLRSLLCMCSDSSELLEPAACATACATACAAACVAPYAAPCLLRALTPLNCWCLLSWTTAMPPKVMSPASPPSRLARSR